MTKESYHHGDLRQTIIEEALIWIEQKDIFSLSLRKIARQIGVSHNAPYRHFPDKESLLVAIAEIGFTQLHQTLQQAFIKSSDDAQKRLETIGVAYIEYAISNQAYYRVMFSDVCWADSQKYPKLEPTSQEAFNVLLDTIKIGQKEAVFNAQNSQELARVCWSLVHGVSTLAIDNQLMTSDADSVIRLAKMATKTLSLGMLREKY